MDASFFYFLPISLSGYLYFNIIKTLRARDKRIARNRNLSICFVISWLLWVVCWAPKFFLTLLQLPKTEVSVSYGKIINTVIYYLYPTSFSIQLLYSQINPLLYFILLKKFQNNFFSVVKLLKVFCYSNKKISDKIVSNKVERNVKPVYGKITPTVLALTLAFGLATITSLEICKNISDIKAKLPETVQNHKHSLSGFEFASLNYRDVMILDPTSAPRKTCAENNGDYNFFFQRCYFILEHPSPGLNISQQIRKCQKQGAILSYPRSREETEFIWRYFEKQKRNVVGARFLLVEALHVGFTRDRTVKSRYPTFTSVDKKLSISSFSHLELFMDSFVDDYISNDLPPSSVLLLKAQLRFSGPGICLSRVMKLSECMPRSLKLFSICSVDISTFLNK